MATNRQVLKNLYEKYIKGIPNGVAVSDKIVFLCHLTNVVKRVLELNFSAVFVRTIPLKHLYEKRPAEEFDFIIDNIHKVVKYPDYIYKNKDPKRGNFCFVKTIGGEKYLCSLELVIDENKNKEILTLVTAFRIRKETYLDSYSLLWNWGNDVSPS